MENFYEVRGKFLQLQAIFWLTFCIFFQVLIPNASFSGHLAGILVGLAYVKGPLKAIIEWPFTGKFVMLFSIHVSWVYTLIIQRSSN